MASSPDPKTHPVLVTGVSGDIGSRLAAHFLDRGHRVLGLDAAPEGPAACRGRDAFRFVRVDLTDAAATAAAIDAFVAEHGPLRIVLNNVGLIHNAPVLSFVDGAMVPHDPAAWDKVLAVTLSAAFYVTTACARHMAQAGGGGVVINISSISANGNPGQSAYSAAKGGVNSLTVAQAKELGPLGIRVAAIAPGFIDTSSTLRAMGEDALKKLKRTIPLRRLGTVEELVHAAQFIVENGYVTGTVLELDGGLTI